MKCIDWSASFQTIPVALTVAVIMEGVIASPPLSGQWSGPSSGISRLSSVAVAQSVTPTLAQGAPDPPRRPPPNQTRPGGGLNPESSALCTPQNDSLRALIPMEAPGLTTSTHPEFFFYVPFGNEDVDRVQFSMLLWPGERQRHYQVEFELPPNPAIISVSLPSTSDYALMEDQYYRWYFQVYCQDGLLAQPDLMVNGTVQRVASTPERDRLIQSGSPEIWHDALAVTIQALKENPGDLSLNQQWQQLLHHIEADDLANTEFVCLMSDDSAFDCNEP